MIVTLFNCKEEQQKETFKSVDCSIYFGDLKSIRVLANGRAYIRYDKNSTSGNKQLLRSEFYSTVLERDQLDSITKMADKLLSIGIDSISELTGDNKLSHSLIIRSNIKLSQTNHKEDGVKDYKLLYVLVNYLDELSKTVKISADTAFVFESRKSLIHPGLRSAEN